MKHLNHDSMFIIQIQYLNIKVYIIYEMSNEHNS